MSCSRTERFHIVKMAAVFLKPIYGFKVKPIKIAAGFVSEIDNLHKNSKDTE